MNKKVRMFFATLSVFFASNTAGLAAVDYMANKIENGYLTVDKHNIAQEKISLSGLTLWEGLDNSYRIRDLIPEYLDENTNFRVYLLRKGYAKITSEKASQEEREAQREAKLDKEGMWDILENFKNYTAINYKNNLTLVVTIFYSMIFSIITSFGFIVWTKKKRNEKKIKISVIGEPGSGKTALVKNIIDPGISPDNLLHIEPSRAMEIKPGNNSLYIPMPPYEFMLEIYDNPGKNNSYIWEFFFTRNDSLVDKIFNSNHYVLIIVLSAFSDNGLPKGSERPKVMGIDKIKKDYIDRQLGYLDVVSGAIKTGVTKKPKAIIVFITKFDLFSDHPPHDSASTEIKNEVNKIFADHIDILSTAAEQNSIPYETIIGSPVRKWNVDSIVHNVATKLHSQTAKK